MINKQNIQSIDFDEEAVEDDFQERMHCCFYYCLISDFLYCQYHLDVAAEYIYVLKAVKRKRERESFF